MSGQPPKPVSPLPDHHLANQAKLMVGKTVTSVDVGRRRPHAKTHEGELIVIRFSDGTAVAIDTGSNAANISDDPQQFHTDFIVEWY